MKQSQKGCLIIALPIAAIILFTGIYLSIKEKPAPEKSQISFAERGYSKTDDNYRLFVYSYTADTTLKEKEIEAELRRHAKERMHTAGRTTTVYYYGGSAPPERTFSTTEEHRRFLNQYPSPDGMYIIMQDGSVQAF